MLNYTISKSTEPPYYMIFKFQQELEFLTAYLFLVGDRRCYEWIKEGIHSVMNQDTESIERDVEWYGALIQRETTFIYPTLEEDSSKGDTVSTEDFDRILTAYFQEKEKYDMLMKIKNE